MSEGARTRPPAPTFEPIAVVGRACVLPGALDPDALFDAVRDGRVLLDHAPTGAWGIDSGDLVAGRSSAPGDERVVSDRGGYVTGFDGVFDAAAFADLVENVDALDDLTRWLLHCTREALREAGVARAPERTGLVVGNLSYPTVEHTRYVQHHWLGTGEHAPGGGGAVDARNRFSSGGPVHIVADAFGLSGDSFALDAACASSLYALDIACRRLQDRDADLMLAGGAAKADPLFIHLGFTALQALSPTGRSRPFHRGADGLLPAEGAGVVVVKRLADAVRDGDRIFGVIRGIGLSNDGRRSGFLAPAREGQVRAMRDAYASAGLTPGDVDFVECHATGTARGDRVELESLAEVWGDEPRPVIGSLKGNLGHPITASGVASLLKVLGAFDAGLLPPTPCDEPLDAVADLGFRLLESAEPWHATRPRRAAISNFGFGGNNAHLLVEEWRGTGELDPGLAAGIAAAAPGGPDHGRPEVAVSSMGVLAGDSVGLPAFVRRLVGPAGQGGTRTEAITLAAEGLGFPPNDLRESLAQQTSILAVVDEALERFGDVDPDRTGVWVGMCVDPQAARHGLRVRLNELTGDDVDGGAWLELNAASARKLTAPGVIGCMPNIPANRVHAWKDWRAPGFTVASEELSGTHALELAVRALRAGDVDVAVVAASDFSHEAAHLAAADAVLPADRRTPGDAAVALILVRREDAEREGRPVLAVVAGAAEGDGTKAHPVELALAPEAGPSPVTDRFGHAHGASALLHVAAGVVTAHLGAELDAAGAWPAPRDRRGVHTRIRARSWTGLEDEVGLRGPSRPEGAISPVAVPACAFFAAGTMDALAAAVADDRRSWRGDVRLAVVARTADEVERLRAYAAAELAAGRVPSAPGVVYGQGAPDGEVAFCYTGAAAAYPGAARDLLLAFPEIGRRLADRFEGTPALAARLYGRHVGPFDPATQLTGSSFVCQAHTEFTRTVLGIEPEVALGLSSGETNSLMAFGVWHDLDRMLADIDASEMYVNQLTGECRAAAAFWDLPEGETPDWRNYRIAAPRDVVEAAVAEEPRVYVTVVHHDEDVVIGGDADGCARVVEKVGRNRAIDLGLDMVVHCAPLAPFEETWHRIHERPTAAVPDVRFYTNAGNRAYVPTREAAADAITRQAIEPVDFPRTIERAWEDGVRVFVEHGPRAIVTGAVGRILAGRPHVAVALDPHEGADMTAVARSVATLWAAGVAMDARSFVQRLEDLAEGGRDRAAPTGPVLTFPAHAPPVVWPRPAGAGVASAPESDPVTAPRPAAVAAASASVPASASRPAAMPSTPETPAASRSAAAMVARSSASPVAPTAASMAPPPADGFTYDIAGLVPEAGHGPSAGPTSHPASARTHDGTSGPNLTGAGSSDRGGGAPPPAAPDLRTVPAHETEFDRVARAHAAYLQRQRDTHETFLSLMFEGSAGHDAAVQPTTNGNGARPRAAAASDVDPSGAAGPAVHPPAASHAEPPAPAAAPTSSERGHAAPPSSAPAAASSSAPASTAAPATTETLASRPGLAGVPSSSEPASPVSPPKRSADGPPSPVIPVAPPIDRSTLPATPWLTREDLEIHAGGVISEIFGELFEQQDGYARQVRMPEPPLLFADRALLIEGEPGTMKKGRVVTETDVREDAWYLHTGRMAPGVVIESGQADLLLISWLGADFLNKGERVYRLLGCDLTFYGELPAPGETLTYDIHVDGHAKTGDVRLFFFHYDCYVGDRLLISVRNGQAGFFTDEELAGSHGVLWKAEDDEPDPEARLDAPPRLSTKRSFTAEEVGHWVHGDAWRCFGEGFELAASHTRTPNTPDGRLRLIDHVPEFDPQGGPWGRGYLRAEAHVPADAWFYDGHFKNDPCMPGTLMADAATQALSFAMAAMGFTIKRDGWRFEPVPGQMSRFLCRGQVIPDGPHTLEYEVFIEEIVDGDEPAVYAALLCKSDGFKVFQCRRFGLRLVPDFPGTTKAGYLEHVQEPRYVGPAGSDVRGDYEGLLACAWGRPSLAFGQMFTKFDGALKCPRLPGPPYHFMSTIESVDVAPGSAAEGGTVVSTFAVDPGAWYFDEGHGHMPFAVLVEALLQPCGWFASYLNFFADTPGDVAFRNLDGEDCVLHRPVGRDVGTLTLTTKLTRFAKAAGTSIVFFEVACTDADGAPVMTLVTDFGFFSPKILEAQKGLPMTDEMRARRDAPSPTETISLKDGGGPLAHLPGMASGTMRMIDDITGYWPDGGEAGLGRVRTFQRIHPDSWYFKAHFYEDPVQPGSLGLEALVQSARALVALNGWLDDVEDPVWEHPIVDFPLAWKYRGQVVPTNREVVTEVEVLGVDVVEGESVTVTVYGTQWVDGLRIYEVPSFAVRVRSGA